MQIYKAFAYWATFTFAVILSSSNDAHGATLPPIELHVHEDICSGTATSSPAARITFLSTATTENTFEHVRSLAAALAARCTQFRRQIYIDYATVGGNLARVSELLALVAQTKPAVVVATASIIVKHLKNSKYSGPVVFVTQSDPVVSGFVASFAKPGGNMTGFSQLIELDEKRIELLKLALPRVERVGVVYDYKNWSAGYFIKWAASAKAIGVTLLQLDVTDQAELVEALRAHRSKKLQAISVPMSFFAYQQRDWLVKFFRESNLPTIYERFEFVAKGGLMAYGPDDRETMTRVGESVSLVLSGVSAGEIPVQRPKDFRFAINLRAAAELGVVVSPAVIKLAGDVLQ